MTNEKPFRPPNNPVVRAVLAAAQKRGEASRREEERRERDRLRRLLDLDDKVEPTPRKAISRDPDAPLAPREAAAFLGVTIEQLKAHAQDGAVRYINVGRGKKRPRYAFDLADLKAFKAARTTLEQPCLSSSLKSPRRTTGTVSKSNVVGFMALRAARLARKPNASRR